MIRKPADLSLIAQDRVPVDLLDIYSLFYAGELLMDRVLVADTPGSLLKLYERSRTLLVSSYAQTWRNANIRRLFDKDDTAFLQYNFDVNPLLAYKGLPYVVCTKSGSVTLRLRTMLFPRWQGRDVLDLTQAPDDSTRRLILAQERYLIRTMEQCPFSFEHPRDASHKSPGTLTIHVSPPSAHELMAAAAAVLEDHDD